MTYATLKTQREARSEYVVLDEHGEGIASIAMTGVPGRDNYPWSWHFHADWGTDRLQGTTQTKREALDDISALWASRSADNGTGRED